MSNIDYTQKPKRPLGVSLAIITSVLIFTILPLLEVAFILSVDNMMVFDEVGRSGMDIMGMDGFRQQMIPQAIFAIGFLIISILSWIGRPKIMRLVLSASIAIVGILTITQQVLPRLNANPTTLDSSREVNQPILIFYLIMTILVTAYSVWYLNRWASRAFYRGHYLQEEIKEMKRIEQEMMPSADNLKSS